MLSRSGFLLDGADLPTGISLCWLEVMREEREAVNLQNPIGLGIMLYHLVVSRRSQC